MSVRPFLEGEICYALVCNAAIWCGYYARGSIAPTQRATPRSTREPPTRVTPGDSCLLTGAEFPVSGAADLDDLSLVLFGNRYQQVRLFAVSACIHDGCLSIHLARSQPDPDRLWCDHHGDADWYLRWGAGYGFAGVSTLAQGLFLA